ncbi:caspase family protein [Streptomyces roseochromogenus]|uniref:caspase family protein n=1 Tax=Streptomyces roseochromogenus TaxID=285450 RepID=UPI000998E5FC|nr:caspase family protein [Streptomyces roseochromogenus]
MSALPDPALSRAVLAGVSRYSKLESLPAVANNLRDLAAVLMSPLSWQLTPQYCTVVAEPGTSHDLLDPISRAADDAEDTLLVYFAGHGLLDGRGELFLGLPGSVQGRSHTGVPYQALREVLMDSRAQRHVIILDCCMSGRALGTMSGQDLLADQAEVDGSYLLAASPENGLALAPPGETHTAFTGELLRLVHEGIPVPVRELDLDVIYQHLRRELAARGRPIPQRRARNTAGRIILADNIAFDPAAAARAQRATEALWPDPADCHTPRAFIEALAVVRAVSGHTIREVSQRATPPVSPGTISALLNRTTMPRSWKTTGIYLEACGLPQEEVDAWHAAWQRLLLSESARPTPSRVPVPSARRSWRTRLIRKKPGSR